MDLKQVQFCFCILAHAGITQPKVWRKYEEYAGGLVGFAVYKWPENKGQLPQDWQSLAVAEPVKSKWADMSIVLATQQLFATAMRLHPAASLYLLVSGDSIPCCSLDLLRRLKQLDKYFLVENPEPQLPRPNDEIKRLLPGYVPVEHEQFLVLRRSDVRFLISQNLDPWREFHEFYNGAGSCGHWLATPDEFVIGSMLRTAIPENQCDTTTIKEVCYVKSQLSPVCPECSQVFCHGQVLQGSILWQCFDSTMKSDAHIAIRKIPSTILSDTLWKRFQCNLRKKQVGLQ